MAGTGAFAGGAAAHGLAAVGAGRGVGLARLLPCACLDSCGIQPLSEAALLDKIAALLLDLTAQQVGRLVHGAKHRIGRHLGLHLGHKVRQARQPGQTHLAFCGGWQVGYHILFQTLAHGQRFRGILVPDPQPALDQEALVVLGQFIGKAGPATLVSSISDLRDVAAAPLPS